jgi:hypothetical protein
MAAGLAHSARDIEIGLDPGLRQRREIILGTIQIRKRQKRWIDFP